MEVSIKDWIYYRPSVGVEGLYITGLPGTGKSNMSNLLVYYCLQEGEHWIIPGDRFCEWRHFEEYPSVCELKVYIPSDEMIELKFLPNSIQYKPYIHRFNSYEDINLEDCFKSESGLPVVVSIYDACLRMADRAKLWAHITDKLINRFFHTDKAIGMLFHEAGNYWPEMAVGDHWKGVYNYANSFVDSRKGLLRQLLVAQLEGEVETRVRQKCMAKVFRKGKPGKLTPEPLRQSVPFLPINEYSFQYGGLYSRGNPVEKFEEKKILYKIIPHHYIDLDLPDSTTTDKYLEKYSQQIKNCYEYTGSISKTSQILGCTRETVRRHIKGRRKS